MADSEVEKELARLGETIGDLFEADSPVVRLIAEVRLLRVAFVRAHESLHEVGVTCAEEDRDGRQCDERLCLDRSLLRPNRKLGEP